MKDGVAGAGRCSSSVPLVAGGEFPLPGTLQNAAVVAAVEAAVVVAVVGTLVVMIPFVVAAVDRGTPPAADKTGTSFDCSREEIWVLGRSSCVHPPFLPHPLLPHPQSRL